MTTATHAAVIPTSEMQTTVVPVGAHAHVEGSLQAQPPRSYSGVGGWLYLLGFSLVVTPVAQWAAIVTPLMPLIKAGTWQGFITPGSATYNPMLAALIGVEVTSALVFSIWALGCLYLLATKSPSFPRLTKRLYLGLLAFQAFDMVAASLAANSAVTGAEVGALIKSAIIVAIWIRYLTVSKRVAATYAPQAA